MPPDSGPLAAARFFMVPALVVMLLVSACSNSSPSTVDPIVSVPPLSSPATVVGSADVDDLPAESGDAPDPWEPVAPTPELQAEFDALVDRAEGGAVAAIRVGGGPLITLASGTEPNGAQLDTDAVVRVGSISKVVTSTLVLSLVDDGQLDLDTPLQEVLPDVPVGGDATIRQLLSHRSGIENYTDDPAFFQSVLRRPNREVTPEDVLGFADPEDATFAPGEGFSYSNTNYVLLGQVLEELTGEDLNTLVQTRIAAPLGLTDLSFDMGDRAVVGGHSAMISSGGTSTMDYTSVATSAWAAGSLVTPVDELARFITALQDGDLVSTELVAEMREPLDAGDEYGLGLHPGPDLGVGHGGSIPGFNSMMQYDPDTGDLLILVVNNDLRDPEALTGSLWEAANAT